MWNKPFYRVKKKSQAERREKRGNEWLKDKIGRRREGNREVLRKRAVTA